MKYLLCILIVAPILFSCGKGKEGNTEASKSEYAATYYLIRHAEKDRTDPKNQDPHLNIDGMMRAKRWAAYFEPIKIDAIYYTKYLRTKQTISFIAQEKNVSPKTYQPNALYSEAFLKENNGKTVLIVGHSNTIPQLVNKLIGESKFTDMEDTDNSTLFKVTLKNGSKKVETVTVE